MAASQAAISVSEFAASCTLSGCFQWRHGIGLCVSGGPDSMALAALFSKIKKLNLDFPSHTGAIRHPLGKVKAFIVDHQAREGSAEEAKTVAHRLRRLGLDAEILRLQWPPGTIPARLPNFETQARRGRYRILAQAAIRDNLKCLYLGHHQDDQAENFIMRLIGSNSGGHVPPSTALLGMQRTAPIPCCHDIYGAFEQDSFAGHPDDGSVHLAHQGLTLARPFLGYAKTRLQATCESMKVQYITDETNSDPTSTRRNAVRHLVAKYKLPRALRRMSLVQRQIRIKGKTSTALYVHKTALWMLLKVQNFDIRSGLLSIRFPNRSHLGSAEDSFTSIAYVLTDLLDAVSPKSRGPITVSADIIERITEVLSTSEHQMSYKNFVATVAGVLVEASPRFLQLSREPIRSTEKSQLTRTFVVASREDVSEGQLWTDWMFWDNRYWLRIKLGQSENADKYAIRAYAEADVESVCSRLRKISSKAKQNFQTLIESTAPGKTKFTLPVVIEGGLIICFPTLNISLPNSSGHNWEAYHLPGKPWQIRYKSQGQDLRLACLRNSIDPSNASGLARSNEDDLRNAHWQKIPDFKELRKTRKAQLNTEIAWLKTLQYDMPAAEFERHCFEVQREYY